MLQDESYAVADSLSADGSIAGKGKTIIRAAIRADEEAVTIFPLAQAGLGADLGVIVGEQGVTAQAGHVDLALHGEGQAVVLNL